MTTNNTKRREVRDWPSEAPLPQTRGDEVIYTTETGERASVLALGFDRWIVVDDSGDVYGPGGRLKTLEVLRELLGGPVSW